MSPQVLSRYESALGSDDALKSLTATVRARLKAESAQDVLAELEELRGYLQAKKDDGAEDVVLDVMDFVTGFCSPQTRLA